METELSLILWIAAAVVVVAVIVFLLLRAQRMRRRKRLRERFGAEYDRTAQREGSKRKADEELIAREQRYKRFDLHPVDEDSRESLRVRWEDLQSSFVDGPQSAVRNADVLLDDAARARGYPDAGPEQRLRDLAVDHPDDVERYRQAVAATTGGHEGRDVERLRRRLLAARGLFDVLLGPEPPAELVSPEPPFGRETTSTPGSTPEPPTPPPAEPHADEERPRQESNLRRTV